MQETNKKEGIGIGLMMFDVIMVVLIIGMFFLIYATENKPVITFNNEEVSVPFVNPFDTISVTAKSAYVYDVVKGEVLYKKNELAQLPLASITKLMMALTASELVSRDSKISIKREFLAEDGDNGLLVDESWKMKDLLDLSLVVSSNDGARSLASVIGAAQLNSTDYNLGRKEFVSKMNEFSKKLGLHQTYFINESGLDSDNTSGGYGSAIDVASLMTYILKNKPEIIEATKYRTLTVDSFNKEHIIKNTNIEVENIPGLIASKTGFTDMAGGNLVVAFDASIGRPIIVVVLGSSEKGRFSDVLALTRASQYYISGQN